MFSNNILLPTGVVLYNIINNGSYQHDKIFNTLVERLQLSNDDISYILFNSGLILRKDAINYILNYSYKAPHICDFISKNLHILN